MPNRIAHNALFLYLRMILVMGVSLYTSRVVLQALGFQDFGLYNLVGSVVVFFSFVKTALSNAAYRYIAFELGTGDRERLSRIYSMAINSHILLAVLMVVALEVCGLWYLNSGIPDIPLERMTAANWTFQISLMTFVVGILQNPYESNVIAHERMNFYAGVGILEAVMKLGVVYLLCMSNGDRLVTYAGLLLGVSLVMYLVKVLYCKQVFDDTRIERIWDKKIFVQLTSYSGYGILVNGADVTTQQMTSIFFNKFVGLATGNAAIGVVNQVNATINQFIASFTNAFNPQVIKAYAAQRRDYFMQLIFSASKVSYIIYVVLAVPILANTEFVLGVWLGEYPTLAPVLIRVTCVFYLVDALQAPLYSSVHATGNIRVHHTLMSVIKFSAIPLMFVAFKLGYGGVGALLCWSLLNVLAAIVRTLYMKRLIRLDLGDYSRRVLLPLLFFSIVTMPVSFYVAHAMGENGMSFLVSSALSTALALGSAWLFVLDGKERRLVKDILSRKK